MASCFTSGEIFRFGTPFKASKPRLHVHVLSVSQRRRVRSHNHVNFSGLGWFRA